MKLKKIAAMLTVAGLAAPAFATNGMNMEGYGPIATGMGGASAAYDNGTAGLINNPATLGLMKSGTSRLDVAIGGLHPDVSVNVAGMSSSHSSGDAYYMPAIGYVRKDGAITWGIGMMSQGGMGTEWGSSSVLSAGGLSTFGVPFAATGLEQRSELGLGRVLLPLTFDVSDSFRIGATFDYVWGGLDMKMAMDGNTFMALASNTNNRNSRAPGYLGASNNFNPLATGSPFATGFNYAYFDFDQGTDKFKQKLTTSGFGANVGFQWQASKELAIGAVYHGKTDLSDMSGSGSMCMGSTTISCAMSRMGGTLKIINFQWPETIGVGLSYQPNDKWQIVADYKHIAWSETMKTFHMTFDSGATHADMFLNLNWDDQNVFQIGAAYKWDDALTLRFGANLANQPVTNNNMLPLFPATITNHYTAGLGYALSKTSALDFSLAIAPNVAVTNPGMAAGTMVPAGTPGMPATGLPAARIPAVTTDHSQMNWQLMFSNKF